MTAATPSLADFNFKTLSRQQKAALQLIDSRVSPLVRAPGGWGWRHPDRVSLDVAKSLQALGLVRVDSSSFKPALALTGAAKAILAVREQGKRS